MTLEPPNWTEGALRLLFGSHISVVGIELDGGVFLQPLLFVCFKQPAFSRLLTFGFFFTSC